ncbi:Hypothetical predicted protein [Marmota monax]|uniref:Uncharacterized protein n=1 Tax=Marmota monax TaxID=9995 RepID=A0A5E4BKJ4_MARMO|nr:Hypothetical predicted protein [Marmota monax]
MCRKPPQQAFWLSLPGSHKSSRGFPFLIPSVASPVLLSVSRRPWSSLSAAEPHFGRKAKGTTTPRGPRGSAPRAVSKRTTGSVEPRALAGPGLGGAGGAEAGRRTGGRRKGVGAEAMEGRSGGMGEGRGREAGGGAEPEPEPELEPEPRVAAEAVMSVQVVSAAAAAKVPEVDLKDLSPSEAEPQLGLSSAAVGAMAPPAGGGDPEAPAPAAERPPAPGPGSGPAAALSPAAGKVPQASAMKRSDPHHQHQRHRDGGEALVSPDGTVTEAPRTVKKVLGPGCLARRGREGERERGRGARGNRRFSRQSCTTLHALTFLIVGAVRPLPA